MEDLISRKEALKALRGAEAITRVFGCHNVYDAIIELPSAEPKQGRWVETTVRCSTALYCSNCEQDSGYFYRYNYCPNCGAKMSEILTDSESEDKE